MLDLLNVFKKETNLTYSMTDKYENYILQIALF